MRSYSRSVNGRPVLHLFVIAALVILCRAPFLLRGDRFFDSDEAVEGLMALHVLEGEPSAFLWGQRYKGVPEVYLAAAVFALTGPSVVALKSVTLACFALFVCLQHVLIERLFPRAIAWIATAFLIVAPPSLVFWSLSANAEIVMTMLAGTVMLLGVDLWRRSLSRPALLAAAAAAGFGLWVQQYIVYYWIALGLAVVLALPQRGRVFGMLFAREIPGWVRFPTIVLGAGAGGYAVLGMVAFLTGGFELTIFGLPIGVRHAQKLWAIAAVLAVMATAARLLFVVGRHGGTVASVAYSAALAFAVGYAPALAAGGSGAPIGRAGLADVQSAMSAFASQIGPILLGLRSPSTAWLGVSPWLAAPLVVAVAFSLVALKERPFTPVFHLLVLTAVALFFLSGAYVDAQSYRYLMPVAGAFAVVLALGVWRTFAWSRVAGVASLATLLTLFALEQRAWYRQLTPDARSAQLIACLDRAGIREAYADYWVSYKVTFLTGERIVIAPDTGVDRYPPYTARVRASPSAPRILDKMGSPCNSAISSP
jgi:hypothetical protein